MLNEYPHTITLCQANAFIFPIADLCTILLTALLAMYGRRIMYAIIYHWCHPSRDRFDLSSWGSVLRWVLWLSIVWFLQMLQMLLHKARCLVGRRSNCVQSLILVTPVLTPHSCTGRVQQPYPDGHYSEQTPYTGHAGQLALQPSYQPPDSSLRPVHWDTPPGSGSKLLTSRPHTLQGYLRSFCGLLWWAFLCQRESI